MQFSYCYKERCVIDCSDQICFDDECMRPVDVRDVASGERLWAGKDHPPIEVAFLPAQSDLNELFWLNRGLDLVFALDMCYQCILGYHVEEQGRWELGGRANSNPSGIPHSPHTQDCYPTLQVNMFK